MQDSSALLASFRDPLPNFPVLHTYIENIGEPGDEANAIIPASEILIPGLHILYIELVHAYTDCPDILHFYRKLH